MSPRVKNSCNQSAERSGVLKPSEFSNLVSIERNSQRDKPFIFLVIPVAGMIPGS
ncbi:Uncharacterised protein [Mycobacteroides abscessus subsp. massiliense]|nr:Uncharacterised protein [Mycobacteroides abscessus subsp. massiliense]